MSRTMICCMVRIQLRGHAGIAALVPSLFPIGGPPHQSSMWCSRPCASTKKHDALNVAPNPTSINSPYRTRSFPLEETNCAWELSKAQGWGDRSEATSFITPHFLQVTPQEASVPRQQTPLAA